MSLDRWLDKENMLHIYMDYYLDIKKKERMPCAVIHGPGDYHPKWSKSERRMQYGITYKMWHKWIYLSDTENTTCGCQVGGGGGGWIGSLGLVDAHNYI